METNDLDIPFMPSTLETVDGALFDFLNEEMNIFATTNKGWKKVPIYWVSAERAYHTKNNKDSRDSLGSVILPAITLERTSVVKDLNKKGSIFAHIPEEPDEKGGVLQVSRLIQQDKSAVFANADSHRINRQLNFPRKNKKIVYESLYIPLPVFLDMTYEINIKTEYQQQLNEIVTPFMTKTGGINHFIITKEGHRYESFIQQDFVSDTNASNIGEEERKFNSKITIKVLGYVIGEGNNRDKPKIAVRENRVQVRLGRERVIVGDVPEHLGDDQGFYRS
jgi:hypothetical protein